MDISIIIVNYNTKQLLYNCLQSLYQQTKMITFEVIVIDNGSVDGSVEMIYREFPQTIIIDNKENVGFGKANNIAAKKAHGKYLFLLNTDTVLLNNAAKYFFDYSESSKKDCIVGSWLMNANQKYIPSYGNYITLKKQCIRYLYAYFPLLLKIRMIIKKNKTISYTNDLPFIVDFVTGADLFLSLELFNKLNGFDEQFFMYHEDDDLCRRANKMGIKSYLISSPKIIHYEGCSSKSSIKKLMIQEQSFFLYLKKYLPASKFRFSIFFYEIFITIRFLSPVYSLKEKIDMYKQTKNIIKKVL